MKGINGKYYKHDSRMSSRWSTAMLSSWATHVSPAAWWDVCPPDLLIHPDSILLLGASFTEQSLAAGEDGPTCLNKSLAVDVLTWVA